MSEVSSIEQAAEELKRANQASQEWRDELLDAHDRIAELGRALDEEREEVARALRRAGKAERRLAAAERLLSATGINDLRRGFEVAKERIAELEHERDELRAKLQSVRFWRRVFGL